MLISIEGDVGSGKTLLSTMIAFHDSRPVYSNYFLNLPNFHEMQPEDLYEINEDTLVLLDEAYTWLESRTSGKEINRYMSYILFQSRKRGIDFIITDQLIETVDVRFRMMINYRVLCQAIPEGFEYDVFKLSRYGAYAPRRFFLPFRNAERYFPIYDTKQKIDAIDKNLMFSVTSNKEDIIEDIDAIRDELLEKAPAKVWTRAAVADHCLRFQIPKHYREAIFNAIKASIITQPAKVKSSKSKKKYKR